MKHLHPSPGKHWLVIGYGNELRSDDDAGPRVARILHEKNLPGVHAIACHQLTPELAEAVASARAVVFVDASVGRGDTLETRPIEPGTSSQIMAHASDPQSLLALTRDLFGRCPPAWLITIPGSSFDLGERLSPKAERGLALAVEEFTKLRARQPADRET